MAFRICFFSYCPMDAWKFTPTACWYEQKTSANDPVAGSNRLHVFVEALIPLPKNHMGMRTGQSRKAAQPSEPTRNESGVNISRFNAIIFQSKDSIGRGTEKPSPPMLELDDLDNRSDPSSMPALTDTPSEDDWAAWNSSSWDHESTYNLDPVEPANRPTCIVPSLPFGRWRFVSMYFERTGTPETGQVVGAALHGRVWINFISIMPVLIRNCDNILPFYLLCQFPIMIYCLSDLSFRILQS